MLRRHRAYILGAAALLSVSPAAAATVNRDDFGIVKGVIVKFKTHRDNPTQIPIGTPITLVFIAAALQFAPTIFMVDGATLFGADGDIAAVDGIVPEHARFSFGDVTADTTDATASILDLENGIRSNPMEADFTVSGTGVDPISDTPLPVTLPLFASGLGALGLLSWRSKRKASVVRAA